MTTQERLKWVMSDKQMNMKEFSDKCGISYRTLQNYLLGKRTIGANALTKICKHMGVNTNWLLTGEGPIYLELPVEMSIGRRLRETIQSQGMNLTDFSKKSGIQYRTLQEYVSDNRMPGGESLIKIHEELRVSLNWLLTGEGPIYLEPSVEIKDPSIDELHELIKKLSGPQQNLLLGLTQEMLTIKTIVKKLGLDEES